MKPILITGRSKCGKTIVGQILQDMGFYLPTDPDSPKDFESWRSPECKKFNEAIDNDDIKNIRIELNKLHKKYPKLALKNHMFVEICNELEVETISCRRINKQKQAEEMCNIVVSGMSIDKIVEDITKYNKRIETIKNKLDWTLCDYWENPEKEIRKICKFVKMPYKEEYNKFNPELVNL